MIHFVFIMITLFTAVLFSLTSFFYWKSKKADLFSLIFWTSLGLLTCYATWKSQFWLLVILQWLYAMASFKVAAANASSIKYSEQTASFLFSALMIASIISILYFAICSF